jgi:hypothetical protein
MSFGIQVATFRQLKAAIVWLRERGCRFIDLPAALSPGIDWYATALDPAGHGVQLYFSMEQIGWEGRVRAREAREMPAFDAWPEAIDATADSYTGEPFLGPWG